MYNKSIRNKLVILLLIATILPSSASIITTYFYTKETLRDQSIIENSKLLYQGKINLESYLNKLIHLTLSPYNSQVFINYLRSSEEYSNYESIEVVKNVIQTLLYSDENIDQVTISAALDHRMITASRKSTILFSRQNNKENPSFLKADESPYNFYIEPIHSKKQSYSLKNKNVITVHRSFKNIPSNEVLAYISIDVLPNTIYNLSQNLYREGEEEFYIISPEGELIYQSNDVVGELKQIRWVQSLLNSDDTIGSINWQDESFSGVMIYERLSPENGGWLLVKRIPSYTLYKSALNVIKINILFAIIGLFLVITATLFISFKITSPIRVLLQNIQKVEEGNMKVQFETLGRDEIGYLGIRFKEMIESMNDLINRKLKIEIENKSNQLRVLQSQINPHFLYNALQSIGTLALKNNVPKIYSLLTHLSKIMRYSMNIDESFVPLLKEMNYSKAYLLLQKERFGDQLYYNIEIDDELSQVRVPKMLLQPIIENYFKHGFDNREEAGEISIYCKAEGAMLEINIVDNGSGISEKRLQEIYRNFKEDRPIGEGESNIGLRNTYTRLKLYYGEKASLQLMNRDKGGLIVIIRFPMEGDPDESINY